MSPRARDPVRALLVIGAAVAILLAAGLLPAFGGAAPLGDLARELGPDVEAPDAPEAPDGPGDGGGGGGGGDVDLPSFRFPFDFDIGIGDGDGDLVPDGDSGGEGGGDEPGRPGGSGGGGGGGSSIIELVLEPLLDWGGDGDGDPGEREVRGNCRGSGDYVVCLPETIHPGRPMPISVRQGDEPAPGVPVRVNGEVVGRTDGEGRVLARAPYTEQIRVSVGERAGAVPPPGGDRAFSLQSDEGVTVGAETGARIELPEDPDPGERVVVAVLYPDDVGVPDVPVFVDGEEVARTDPEGLATVTMPAAERVTLHAERGDVRAEGTVTLFDARVTVDGPLGIPLPASETTVQVTEAGEPLHGATVSVDGRHVGETGPNGTVAAALPLSPVTSVSVEADGVTHSATQHLWVGPLVALLLVGGVASAGAGLWRRSEASGRDVLAETQVVLRTYGHRLTTWLVTLAANTEAALASAAAGVRAFVADLEAPSVALTEAIRARVAALLAWLDPRPRLATARERVRRRFAGEEQTTAPSPDATRTARDRVERAWARLVARLDPPYVRTMTPGQVARRAVAAGLPRRAVRRLTRAYRAVEYADADPETYADEAERAVAELEGTGDGEDEP